MEAGAEIFDVSNNNSKAADVAALDCCEANSLCT